MNFPGFFKKETYLFLEDQDILLDRLKVCVAKPSRKNAQKTATIIFNGEIGQDSFSITKNSSHPQYFIPNLNGYFIQGEKETLLSIEYKLFSGASLLLILWTSIGVLAIFYCVLIMNKVQYSFIALIILILNYLIAFGNFRLHSNQSRKVLLNIFNQNEISNISNK